MYIDNPKAKDRDYHSLVYKCNKCGKFMTFREWVDIRGIAGTQDMCGICRIAINGEQL